MTSRKVGAGLGIAGLLAWAAWWVASFSVTRLLGAERFWITFPAFGADFWSQTDYAARVFWGGVDVYTREDHLFHYPPIVIRLFSWTTLFTPNDALAIWLAVMAGLIAYGTVVALRCRKALLDSDPPAPLVVLLVLLSFPTVFAMERANFDALALAAILIGVAILRRGGPLRDFAGGYVLAVAPWVKLYPGLMGVGLVALRRIWTLIGFAVGGLTIGLFTPRETLRSFHILGLAIQRNLVMARAYPFNQWSHSLSGAWLWASHELSDTAIGPAMANISESVAPFFFIAPLLGWVCLRVFRSKHGSAVTYPLLLWICALASCQPIIANDYSLLYLPLAAVAVYGSGAGRLAHLTLLLSLPWWQPFRLPVSAYALLACKLSALVSVGAALVARLDQLDRDGRTEAASEPLPFVRFVRALGGRLAASPPYVEIFATSLAGLLLEIAYTRIFSFKIYYYFTYPLLGVGLLGIGAGGIALSTSERLRKVPLDRLVPITAFAGGASVLAGYAIIAALQLNIGQDLFSALELGKLLLTMLVLLVSFFCVGLCLSAILTSRPEAVSKLYGADLAGAALGCALSIPLIATVGPPRAVALAGLILSLGGLRFALGKRLLFRAGVALACVLAVPVVFWGFLRDPVVAESKQYEHFRNGRMVWFSQWSPVFRIDVATQPMSSGDAWVIFHDGQFGSALRYFDGSWAKFRYFDTDSRALAFHVAPRNPKVLIIGAAGGQEILASLYFDASHVTGVELNPVTYSLLTTVFADVTGHLAENPKVTLLNGDGRWFLAQSHEEYDLVWFVAPDSYAAMNASTSASFVLSESYLYTVEMVKQSLEHLTPGGIICTQFGEVDYQKKPNRTTRYVATSRAAFAEEGVSNFGDHVLVGKTEGFPFSESVVILGKGAFTKDRVAAFASQAQRTLGGAVRYAPGQEPDATPVNQVITLPEGALPDFFAESRYQVDPVRDDAPFFWHFTRFRDALRTPFFRKEVVDYEDSIAEQMTVLFLALLVVLSVTFVFLPLLTIRRAFREMPHKALSATYFGALGLGFMFLEVGSIQKLTLLLGYPTYSLTVTLLSLLSSTGASSLLWSRYTGPRNRALVTAYGLLVGVVLVEQALLPTLTAHFAGSSLFVRVMLTVALVAPIGLALGAFLPAGLRTVSRLSARSREYAAWVWAVNGFFSVIGSVLSTILGMVIGFRDLLLVSLLVYGVGVLAFTRVREAEGGVREG